jgi:hypothetical protein
MNLVVNAVMRCSGGGRVEIADAALDTGHASLHRDPRAIRRGSDRHRYGMDAATQK